MKPRIFFSYTAKDSAYAELLADLLKEKGFDTWTDANLTEGEEWSSRMLAALKKSDLFIPLVSKEFFESSYALMELGAAYSLDKRIIPILTSGDVEHLPLRFRKFQVVDAQKTDKDSLLRIIEQQTRSELAA